jgi:pyruvate kinase
MRGRERNHRLPATKIVCTIGPASAERRILSDLVREGMSVARLNFSHGTHAWHGGVIGRIREEAASRGKHVAVMQDLQGPKVRLGIFTGGKAVLVRGSSFTLTTERLEGDASAASVDYKGFPGDVAPGDAVLLADGLVRLVVREVRGRNVLCRVAEGGEVGDRKGVNIPGKEVSLPSLTRKDLRDLSFGLSRGVDFVALSFVRRAEDVRELKRRIRRAGKNTSVIAKLEKSQALQYLGEILEEADGVIVARGDLGVETAIEEVPVLQKRILREASRAGVVAITATQMLESMTRNRVPTRAEASDVANAVLDGSDAVMLSAETSVGANPVEAVRTMRKILSAIESERLSPVPDLGVSYGVPGVVADAASRAATSLGAKAIVVFTRSGNSARILSKFLPETPIIAFTPKRSSARRMALYRGVEPGVVKKSTSSERMVEGALREMREAGQVSRGDRLVIVYGSPTGHCDQMRVVSL